MLLDGIAGWPCEGFNASIRYSRGSDFSGTCYYATSRIFVNLGRHNRYPYRLLTNIARPKSSRTHWWRELYSLEVADPYQLVLFVFLHEYYHWLVQQARRNVRQKEGRCDRFAARVLVDRYGVVVRDAAGHPVPRYLWDFQDLDGFVAAARQATRAARRPLAPRSVPPKSPAANLPSIANHQGLLFSLI
jgi:hypothetical protein